MTPFDSTRPARLIEWATPRPEHAERVTLRLLARANHPHVLVPAGDALWELYWLSPLVCESPAPMPRRHFGHVARVLADMALRDPVDLGRN